MSQLILGTSQIFTLLEAGVFNMSFIKLSTLSSSHRQ